MLVPLLLPEAAATPARNHRQSIMRVALKRVENDSNEPGDIQRIFDDHIPMRILSFQVGVIVQYCFIAFKIWIDTACETDEYSCLRGGKCLDLKGTR